MAIKAKATHLRPLFSQRPWRPTWRPHPIFFRLHISLVFAQLPLKTADPLKNAKIKWNAGRLSVAGSSAQTTERIATIFGRNMHDDLTQLHMSSVFTEVKGQGHRSKKLFQESSKNDAVVSQSVAQKFLLLFWPNLAHIYYRELWCITLY